MTFEEILDQTLDMLQRRGRVSYRALQRQFHLDDAYLADLKAEIVEVLRLAVDQDHTMLVWTGDPGAPAAPSPPAHSPPPGTQAAPPPPEAERRQLTVMFCDLVGSTALSAQLDPEDLREVVRAYQTTCAEVIQRFDGHIAQYLGDGLLVYFGYPQAHEDNAQRAIRAGLGIIAAMVTCNTDLEQQYKVRLAVRLGIHTGLVVVGEMGGGGRQEQLALGETPNIAARLQGFAAPDTVVISEATARLTQGFFLCQALGAQAFKGLAQPLQVYHVLHESAMQTRLDVAAIRGLTPLVGREHEVGVLRERWAQVNDGPGHVILLSGEPGIGKSRLVQVLKEQVADTPHVRWECRCSPYHQHSALYPLIDLLQRLLRWQEDPSPVVRLAQLEQLCSHARLPLPEMVPLLAALLSFPLPADRYPPIPLLPRRQKQQMLEGLLTLMAALAARQPLLFILEDVHWIDPSTLDFLQLLLDQGPPARVLSLLTSRPTVQLPDRRRPHLTSLVLTRLAPPEVETMVVRLTAGKTLPPEVRKQVITKTDGVPLFVEELTKMVLESGLLTEVDGHYTLTGPLPALAIPTTLHDSLMARLDRLAAVKTVAQLGATIGRQFPYPLLQAVAALDDQTLQAALHQLVDAELLYGQGVPPDATYLFKHALIQEAAYQSLLRSTRQQYHQQIAQVIAARFPEIRDTQPELLAYHYTEAGLGVQALEYWRRAGERANQRWAFVEASHHLTRGLEVLRALPESPEDVQYELTLQIALLTALQATRGFAAPEVGHVCTRARALCQQVGESPQLLEVLLRLSSFYLVRGELHTARELGEACHSLAQRLSHAAGLLSTYRALGITYLHGGAFVQAQEHFAQGLRLYHPSRPPVHPAMQEPGRACFTYGALALWFLGYPEQAWHRMQEALTLVQASSDPFGLAYALHVIAAMLHQCRGEGQAVQAHARAAMDLSRKHDLMFPLGEGMILDGWALVAHGQGEAGLTHIRQGIATYRATGATLSLPVWLGFLAEAYGKVGQPAQGLPIVTEALAVVEETGARAFAAELYRLKGTLALQAEFGADAAHGRRGWAAVAPAVEEDFWQAMATARQQQAKSLELRAAMSLARLWQQQDKQAEAHELLVPVYGWFTEGFDTADLQEAKTLLDALA